MTRIRLLACILMVGLGRPVPALAHEVRESQHLFGSIVALEVTAPDPETGQYWIDQALETGRRLERDLRDDDERSELRRLNLQAGQGPARVPPDLYRLLALSQLLSRVTGGAYDATIGPLTAARAAAAREDAGQGDDAIDAALASVGYDRLLLHPPDRVELARAGMAIDFGPVAKGYALSRMAARLRELGATQALLHFGNSLFVAVGPPAGAAPWRIAVPRGNGTAGTVALRDRALAIMHSLRRDEDAGSQQPHVADPRSGRWIEASRQAAVLALDGAIAAGWSMAMIVDPDGVTALMDTPRDVEAIVFDEHGEHSTARFAAYSEWAPARRAAKATASRKLVERPLEIEAP